MEMKKVACVVFFAAASISVVAATEVPAPAPGPSSGANAVGSFVGASIISFVAYYLF
ncbi:hypothetical protein TanjilG_23077 [Lupinus angustifolius]|uniref:Arabinogalactan peptide 23-like n=1 Tax=Lupinus angustifolius TaxID=3871 RepID=A0A1J7HWQ1_LUPAN|nr:PREDICTED: arabinogalactan peptide 23-like [Lupinus angustifolius]OIW06197.1 hypothetical protein TanjilG_23077 [Lupinus angustifolius]